MESSDSIDKSWESTSDTTATGQRSDPIASAGPPSSNPGGWMVNIAGRDIVEMSHADVVSRWRNGELVGSVLVWREGMENWAKLESVPAFQIIPKPAADEDSATTEDTNTNAFAVYERPAATLIFDEAVEDDWKGANAREPSKAARGSEPSKTARSSSARPPAPDVPPLAPRRSPQVPLDEPPPPPPLPPRRSPAPARPAPGRPSARPAMPTIPGGLTAPTPRPASVAPAKSSFSGAPPPKTAPPPPSASPTNSPIPAAPPSSPLLAAIAAAASSPEPVVVVAAAAPPPPAAPILDELSVNARLRAMKSVSLRTAVVACAGSALVASLVTGLVVGSGSRGAARRPVEPPAKVVAAAAIAPSPAPTPAPAPTLAEAPAAKAPDSASAEKVALTDLEVAEKPKPKPTKVSTWKPPKPAATAAELASNDDRPPPNPNRDDPERAVPDRVNDRPAQPANWQADPGF